MGHVQALTPITPTLELVELFGPVCHVNPYGAIQNPVELVNGCHLFEYHHGQQAAMVALAFSAWSGGIRCHINALQTIAQTVPLQTRQIMQAIEKTAVEKGADVLTLSTQHKAIAAGATRWGGHISGAIVRKYLGVH